MSEETEALVLDLVEFVAGEPRPYAEVMDAWRTSCPRLTIWEEPAQERSLIHRFRSEDGVIVVAATDAGHALLQTAGRRRSAPSATQAA